MHSKPNIEVHTRLDHLGDNASFISNADGKTFDAPPVMYVVFDYQSFIMIVMSRSPVRGKSQKSPSKLTVDLSPSSTFGKSLASDMFSRPSSRIKKDLKLHMAN